ncbi:TadE/TadG family type IV pilus assembly protein [Streptomyces sp. NPDC001401]|uniref:TadE/TadG family type IV pilus assembly protein n=1 Tax=Streptomyces sp. NPDC001401 TaxID=3364570 RepID=UPI00369A669A
MEMVIGMPLMFLIVLLLAQTALYFHAAHIAQAAASHALAVARVENGSAAAGENEAQYVLNQIGRGPLHHTQVAVRRGEDRAEVRVSGEATSVVPFVHVSVRARAAGPIEAFEKGGGPP